MKIAAAMGYPVWALLCYLVLITYCSLVDIVPGTGWHTPSAPYWAFLRDPWLPSVTLFDVATNIGAYVPIGSLFLWSCGQSPSAARRIMIATAFGFCWSFAMESLQMWRPSRDPSPVDLFTNTLGTFCGAWLAVLWSPPPRPLYAMNIWRLTVLPPDAHAYTGILALSVWCSFHCAPFVPKVDAGQVLQALAPLRNAALTQGSVDALSLLKHLLLIAGLGMSLASARQVKPGLSTIFTIAVLATVCLKPLIAGRQLTPEFALGTLAGLALYTGVAYCCTQSCRRGKVGAFLLLLAYAVTILQSPAPEQVRIGSFNTIANIISLLVAAFVALLGFAAEFYRNTFGRQLHTWGARGLLIVAAATIALEFHSNTFAVAGLGFALLLTAVAGWLFAFFVARAMQRPATSRI